MSSEHQELIKSFKIYDENLFNELEGFSSQEIAAIEAYRSIKIPETDEDVDLIWKTNAMIANALGYVNTLLGRLEAIEAEINHALKIQSARLWIKIHRVEKMTVEKTNQLIILSAENILEQKMEIQKKISSISRLKEGLEAKSWKAQKLEDRIQSSWYQSGKTLSDIDIKLEKHIPESIRK